MRTQDKPGLWKTAQDYADPISEIVLILEKQGHDKDGSSSSPFAISSTGNVQIPRQARCICLQDDASPVVM